MNVKLGIGVPNSHVKHKVEEDLVVVAWQDPFKNRDPTLQYVDSELGIECENKERALTCNRSSISHAASFFIRETLPPNFWIVSQPKVGTCLDLCGNQVHIVRHSS